MPPKFDIFLFRFFVVWYIIGVFLLSFDLVPPWLEWANVVFLICSGLLGCIFFVRGGKFTKGILAIIIIFFLSMGIESFGVHTGLFFGDYTYETDFGMKLFDVPITIGFAWLMVMATSHVLAAPITSLVPRMKGVVYAIYGGIIATSLDLIIDPVAYEVKRYWVWNDGGFYYNIPFSNFYGWFILSFILHLVIYGLFHVSGRWINTNSKYWSDRMVALYIMMALMFTIIALVNGIWLAPFLSIVTLLLFILVFIKLTRNATYD